MLTVALALTAACSNGEGDDRVTGPAAATSVPVGRCPSFEAIPLTGQAGTRPDLEAIRVRLTKIAELDNPIALVPAGDDLLVITQGGTLNRIRDGVLDDEPLLDISDQITSGGERGLMGLALSPDGAYLYLDFTDTRGDTRIVEYPFADGRPDPSRQRLVLTQRQPQPNHNGGEVVFGPDGKLYIGFGDGGGAGDQGDGHARGGNGQSLRTFLGKLLRIDPRPCRGQAYSVPPDNPFVGRDGARPEIWAYGLRNPWRFHFDRANGELWIGDVGQSDWEEVDRQPAGQGGANYGWNRREGRHQFVGEPPPDAVDPIFEYSSDRGCSIVGGFVYRGSAIAAMAGAYLYTDYCTSRIYAVEIAGGRRVSEREIAKTASPSSFGEDADGELYVLSLAGVVYRIDPGG